MMIIQSYDPDKYAELLDRYDTEVRLLAEQYASDNDYSLSQKLADVLFDQISGQFSQLVVKHMQNDKRIAFQYEQIELMRKMLKIAEQFYIDYAKDHYD